MKKKIPENKIVESMVYHLLQNAGSRTLYRNNLKQSYVAGNKERIDKMWRNIKGYEGMYEINETGTIRRMEGTGSDGRRVSSHLVSSSRAVNGMQYIALWKEGQRKTYMLHKLYAAAFQVTESEACRRIYGGFIGNAQAIQNVRNILLHSLHTLEKEHEVGTDRHDEILYIKQFLYELKNDGAYKVWHSEAEKVRNDDKK